MASDFEARHLRLAQIHVSQEALSFTLDTQRLLDHFQFDSPLERAFFIWYLAEKPGQWRLRPQSPVLVCGNSYRLDFEVFYEFGTPGFEDWRQTKIAVELDGHGFHERTPQQVQRRDQRDRDLQLDGWKVLHFSFLEFDRDPVKCIEVVHEAVWEWFSHEQKRRRALSIEAAKESE